MSRKLSSIGIILILFFTIFTFNSNQNQTLSNNGLLSNPDELYQEMDIDLSEIRKTRSPPGWMPETRLTYSSGDSVSPDIAVWGSNVHVVWHDNRNGNYDIYYKRSIDNGSSWSADIKLGQGHSMWNYEWPRIAIFENNIHVFWEGPSGAYYINSTDNGNSWSEITVFNGWLGHCDVAVWGNYVYIVVCNKEDNDILLKRSSDNGNSWTDWILVNDLMMASRNSIEVYANTIYIIYYIGSGSGQWLRCIESYDQGDTWINDHLIKHADTGVTGEYLHYHWATSMQGSSLHIVYLIQFDNIGVYSNLYGKVSDNGEALSIDVDKDQIAWGEKDESNNPQLHTNKYKQITDYPSNSIMPSILSSGEITHIIWVDDRDGNNELYYTQRLWRADLSISDTNIQFTPPNPIELGETIYINATVFNYLIPTSNVEVKFYKGNPDLNGDLIPDSSAAIIGNDTIDIDKDTFATASIMWIPSIKDSYGIYVWADPENNTKELNYSNNLAPAAESLNLHDWVDRFDNELRVGTLENCELLNENVTLRYDENATNWEYEYNANIEPDQDGWDLRENAVNDLANSSGGVLNLNTTPENVYWWYNYNWSASNTIGFTLEAKLRIEDIGPNSDLFLFIRDGTYYEGIHFLENKIQGWYDSSLVYYLNTTDRFHIYRITAKENDFMVYVDGHVCIDGTDKYGGSTSSNVAQFGDTSDSSTYMSWSYWDYVKFNTTGVLDPKHFSEGLLSSIDLRLPFGHKWDELFIDKTELPETYINVTLIDGVSGNPIPGFVNLNDKVVNISSIDPKSYPLIKLIGNFIGTPDKTPILHSWAINYTPFAPLIYLSEGWNFISLPTIQSNSDIQEVMQSIDGDYDSVQWYNSLDINDPWKHYHISKPSNLNDLNNLNHTKGIFIHITALGGTTFVLNGTTPSTPQKIPLAKGWNLVGYPSLSHKSRANALNNLTFNTHVDAILTYNSASQRWEKIGESDYFEIGRGYYIYAKSDCVWEVPL